MHDPASRQIPRINLPIKAFIFDLDGVIIDTGWYHYVSWKYVAEKINLDFHPEDNDLLKGLSRPESLDMILKWAGITKTSTEKEQLCELKNKRFFELVNRMSRRDLLPGVLDFIQATREKGFKIGLGSGSRNAKLLLAKLQLSPYFDAVIDGNDIASGKPDPEVYLKTAGFLRQAPTQCLVFEDSPAGIEAARAAGMRVIGVGNSDSVHKADYIIPDFEGADLIRLLNGVSSE